MRGVKPVATRVYVSVGPFRPLAPACLRTISASVKTALDSGAASWHGARLFILAREPTMAPGPARILPPSARANSVLSLCGRRRGCQPLCRRRRAASLPAASTPKSRARAEYSLTERGGTLSAALLALLALKAQGRPMGRWRCHQLHHPNAGWLMEESRERHPYRSRSRN